ncbi:conserved protein of unknown function [Kyrpidia spormannii]|uniref:Uncharacterized protein n=2 Tax=Kyrpidia spormannii TaxID=2055160 RepID=A0ACA8ZCL5_9BACL|nr:conserved protein of unknown function [Kyrpidia spormannii]CAB3395919.1 conserved protein of unknown function [Kyrpidia spormannii]
MGLFDNLKTAVVKMLSGRNREEQESFAALRAHYVFEAEFCNVRSGNEKGQVENLVGYVRRNALTPLVEVASLEDLNSRILLSWCDRVAETDRVPHTDETVAAVYTREKEALHPFRLNRLKLVGSVRSKSAKCPP